MSHTSELSASEFLSLTQIGAGPLLGVEIPPGHVRKLAGYRYIELRQGHYEATVTGLLRIASGN